MPSSPIVQLQLALAVGGIMFALWKGDVAARIAGGAVAANLASGLFLKVGPGFEDMLRFAEDGLTAMALLAVALRYAAPWTGAVMLLYAAQFSLHAYYMMTGRPETDHLHAVINNFDFSGIILCLIAGAAVAWRRRVQNRRTRAGAR